ncbi:MAG: hypothetical protein VX372_01100 [Verrucomicrobiota bacterium]|nr:hypothetical protein [Verrucomicrobiota bacterium]MEE2988150.1 hypothetical protein [Verrucomicrobiota bacterium]
MELSDVQKAAVTQWIQEGHSLADVQRSLREDYEISMTYMDVRFLVDDLDIEVVEEEPEPPELSEVDAEKNATAEPAETELVDEGGNGAVTVDVDAIMRPGSLVSGTVVFSDGVSLAWQLSAAGQLGLIPGEDPEYRPSPDDLQSFQSQLEEVLRKKGF